MRWTWPAALLVVVLASAAARPAPAQSRRYPPELRDADEDAALRSKLWERVLLPNHDLYTQRVDYALRLVNRGREASDREAQEVLESAIELAPGAPEAHWLMGLLHERREQWDACARSYAKVFAVDPGFRPLLVPDERKPEWALDYGLALCHTRAGAYEPAIAHHKRILSRGFSDAVAVHRQLGQVYMALGRLDEAIAALETALRHRQNEVYARYALAVAHDRNEQPDQARRYLEEARTLDRGRSHLNHPRAPVVPADDTLYYMGLVHAHEGAAAWALVYFRHYLHVAGQGPWAHRARFHATALSEDPAWASGLEIDGPGGAAGPAGLDAGAVAAAVERAAAALQACVAPVPEVLFDVRIVLAGGAGGAPRAGGGRAPGPAQGVRALALYSFAPAPEPVAEAQRCLEGVAERIALPRPRNAPYAGVHFPVIAHLPPAR